MTATATDVVGNTTTTSALVTIPNGPTTPTVLFVVADPASLSVGDTTVHDHLAGLGFVVDTVDDDLVTTEDATASTFVFVASSTNTAAVNTTFHDVSVPVWMAKPYLLDDMGMTGPTATVDYGAVASVTADIVDDTHPMAGGQSGSVVMSANGLTIDHSFGVPGPDATIVATAAGSPISFMYGKGSALADGTIAAGCRIAASAFQGAPSRFSTGAWAMFDATVTFAANDCPGTAIELARAAMIVGDPAALSGGELAIRDRLVGLGFEVTAYDDDVATPATVDGSSIVVISSGAKDQAVGSKFHDLAIPLVVAKPYLFDDSGLTGAVATVDYGVTTSATIEVVAPTHPIANGLSGSIPTSIIGGARELSFGVPGAAATIVATAADGRAVTFVYRARTPPTAPPWRADLDLGVPGRPDDLQPRSLDPLRRSDHPRSGTLSRSVTSGQLSPGVTSGRLSPGVTSERLSPV
ncbi:MAG: hypothetical protein R2705_15190 [Ilumatobacteraceae bacterium]